MFLSSAVAATTATVLTAAMVHLWAHLPCGPASCCKEVYWFLQFSLESRTLSGTWGTNVPETWEERKLSCPRRRHVLVPGSMTGPNSSFGSHEKGTRQPPE